MVVAIPQTDVKSRKGRLAGEEFTVNLTDG